MSLLKLPHGFKSHAIYNIRHGRFIDLLGRIECGIGVARRPGATVGNNADWLNAIEASGLIQLSTDVRSFERRWASTQSTADNSTVHRPCCFLAPQWSAYWIDWRLLYTCSSRYCLLFTADLTIYLTKKQSSKQSRKTQYCSGSRSKLPAFIIKYVAFIVVIVIHSPFCRFKWT